MADSTPLAVLLKCASDVFGLASSLGYSFARARDGGEMAKPNWNRHAAKFGQLTDALLELSHAIDQPPDGFKDVVPELRTADKICKAIQVQRPELGNSSDYLDFFPELNSVGLSGQTVVQQAFKSLRASGNLPFGTGGIPTFPQSRPSVSNPKMTAADYRAIRDAQRESERTTRKVPDYPLSPMAFLESIRDQIHNLAESKRLMVDKGYSDSTLSGTLSGIHWTEATQRLKELSDLPAETVQNVARILRRELTVGTVEHIDELLTPVLRALRDAWEERHETPTKPLQSEPKLSWPKFPYRVYADFLAKGTFSAAEAANLGQPIQLPIQQYEPTAQDLVSLRTSIPEADPADPPWLQIKVKLLAAAVAVDLATLDAQTAIHLLAEVSKPKLGVVSVPSQTTGPRLFQLLSVFTNGIADERMERAQAILLNENLSTDEKLTGIDTEMPLPPTASAEQLGKMLGVSKQAVLKTDWWKRNRKGEKASLIGRRTAVRDERAKSAEPERPPKSDD